MCVSSKDLEVKKRIFDEISTLNKVIHDTLLEAAVDVELVASSLPSLDNNIWNSYPQVQSYIRRAIGVEKTSPLERRRKNWKTWKRSVFGVVLEILHQLLCYDFQIKEIKIKGSRPADATTLLFTYSGFENDGNLDGSLDSRYWGRLWSQIDIENYALVGVGARSQKNSRITLAMLCANISALFLFTISLPKRMLIWRKLKYKTRSSQMFIILRKEFYRGLFGFPALQSIILSRQFKKFLKKSPATRVLTPYENQLWERLLSRECRRRNVILAGYMHSSPRFWDLRYFDFGPFKKLEPHFIVENGPTNRRLLLQAGYSEKRIMSGPAIRFLHLSRDRPKSQLETSYNPKAVLVITGGVRRVTESMVKVVSSSQYYRDRHVSFRPHPADVLWFQKTFPNLSLDNSIFDEYSQKYGIFLVDCHSSLAVELLSLRKQVLVFLPGNELNQSPTYFIKDFEAYFQDESSLLEFISVGDMSRSARSLFALENPNIMWGKLMRDLPHGR